MTATLERRSERAEAAVSTLVGATPPGGCFRLDDARAALPEEPASYVGRLIGDLVADGWLVREAGGAYRWNPSRGGAGRAFEAGRYVADRFGRAVHAQALEDRPREKLLQHGAATLTDAELLAVLINRGRPRESASDAGRAVAAAYTDRLDRLPEAGLAELRGLSMAVGPVAYCQIMAGVELGRRVATRRPEPAPAPLDSAAAAKRHCLARFARLAQQRDREEFHVVTLNIKLVPIDHHRVSVGTLDSSPVHPRDVFRPALRDAAASVLLLHNHPSGDPTPSQADRRVTRRLVEAGRVMGVEVTDHVILGRTAASLRELDPGCFG